MDTPNQNTKVLTDSDIDIMTENLVGKAIKTLSAEDSLLYEYFIASPYMADFEDLNSNEHRIFLATYSGLPLSLKNFIATGSTANTLYSIGKEYNLADSKISTLSATLRDLVLGKIFIKDFPVTLSSKLGIDDIKAGEIVNKIVSQSFGPIIEDVKRIQRGKFPDKVMAMQKDSQPTGLSPRPQVSEEIKNMPLTQPIARQDVQSVRPPLVPPTTPPINPAPQQSKPPVPQAPVDFSQVRQAQDRPTQNQPPQPPMPQPPPVQKPPIPPVMPELKLPPRPQFKMPDLGPQINPALQNQSKPFEPGQPKPSVPVPSPLKTEQTQKSLEDELLKVANVIDLRAKSEE